MVYKKSAQTKKHILACAAGVFSRKGFAHVTMSDIVTACEISRGGVYRYFQSTAAVFLAVFNDTAQQENEFVYTALDAQESPKIILTELLNSHRRAIIGEGQNLAMAAYEFFIENEDEQLIRRWQFDNLAETMRELIDAGIEKKEFYPVDAAAWGRHLAYFIEGMKLTVPILDLPVERVDEEIHLLLEPLLLKK